MRCLRKLILGRDNDVLDVIPQLVCAQSWLWSGAIGARAGSMLLIWLGRCTVSGWCGLRCRRRWILWLTLHAWLVDCMFSVRSGDTYVVHGIGLLRWRSLLVLWRRLAVRHTGLLRSGPESGRRRRVPVRLRCRSASVEQKRLSALTGLLSLKCRGPNLDQGVFDGLDNVGRKHGSGVNGTRDRLLPRLQHLIHLAAGLGIDCCIGTHEYLV
jgi:hypothetical protein